MDKFARRSKSRVFQLTDKLPLYAVTRLLRKQPRTVRQWIQSGVLEAENEGTEQVPRWMISRQSLQRFVMEHRELIRAGYVDRGRLEFILRYVFPDKRVAAKKTGSGCLRSLGRKRRRKVPLKRAKHNSK